MSFVSAEGSPGPTYCTSAPNITLNSELEGDNVTDVYAKTNISVT